MNNFFQIEEIEIWVISGQAYSINFRRIILSHHYFMTEEGVSRYVGDKKNSKS